MVKGMDGGHKSIETLGAAARRLCQELDARTAKRIEPLRYASQSLDKLAHEGGPVLLRCRPASLVPSNDNVRLAARDVFDGGLG